MLSVTTIFIFALSMVLNADLIADRMAVARRWTLRVNSAENLQTTYVDQYMVPSFSQTLTGTGVFAPRVIALEYSFTLYIQAAIFGFVPTITFSYYDETTTKWIDNDTLQIDYTLNYTQSFDPVTQTYYQYQVFYRLKDYIRFVPGTAILKEAFNFFTDDFLIAGDEGVQATLPAPLICEQFIFPACNGSASLGGPRPYLNETGYSTVAECVDFINSLPTNPCPYSLQGNTPLCRAVHALSALFLPEVHCPHVRPVSEVCRETCLPECSNCHPNAFCKPYMDASFPADFTTHYKCQCKNGYVGNGTHCAPLPCSSGNCPSKFGSYECSSGLCKCHPSFTAQPDIYNAQNDLCLCPPPAQVHWINGQAICVPEGRCVSDQTRYTCNQNWNEVKCANLTNNRWTSFGACTCNYGFLGGFEYPCTCPAPKRQVYSNDFDGKVCLSSTECTEHYHCNWPQQCVKATGNKVGTCTSPKRSLI